MYVEFTFDVVEVEDGVGDGVVEDVVDGGGLKLWKIPKTLDRSLKRFNK
jgi:hypothetical protein